MEQIIFPHDNNSLILIPQESTTYFSNYRIRPYHESLFRDISYWLIGCNIIKGNIVDLGCWIGDNSLPWSQMTNHTIYAIDPSDDNCNYIKRLININEVTNINVIQSAISDKDEMLSTNDNINHAAFNQNLMGNVKVPSTSLDSLMLRNSVVDVDFIHLDVEGMELVVLKGALKLINTYRPFIVYEIHLLLNVSDNNSIAQLLSDNNYRIYIINEVLPGCRPDCRNVLAVPIERDENIVDRLTKHLNTFNYVVALHIRDRCDAIKFTNLHQAYRTLMYLRASHLSYVLLRYKDQTILEKYGERISECTAFAKTVKIRDDYFIQQ